MLGKYAKTRTMQHLKMTEIGQQLHAHLNANKITFTQKVSIIIDLYINISHCFCLQCCHKLQTKYKQKHQIMTCSTAQVELPGTGVSTIYKNNVSVIKSYELSAESNVIIFENIHCLKHEDGNRKLAANFISSTRHDYLGSQVG